MSDQDNTMKTYMSNNNVFADAFNSFMYKGKQVIKPEELVELDPKEIAFLEEWEREKKGKKTVNAERDVLKMHAVKKHGNFVFCIMGAENQTYVNYAGPYVMLTYDYFRCRRQIREIMKAHQKEKDLKGDEFESKFSKVDKIIGVIKLLIFYSGKEWDGPRFLHDMYAGDIDEETRGMMLDYKLNLIEPAKMSEEEFATFETSLGDVLHFCKHTEDKKAMEAFFKNVLNKNIDTDAARVIDAIGNIGMEFKEGEKVSNMCTAIEEMKKENEAKGMLANVKTVMKKMKMTAEQAMDFLDVNEDSRAALLKML